VDALKEQRDSYKDDAEKLPDVQKELDKLKKEAKDNDGDEWKGKYNKVKKDYEDYKAEIQKQKEMATKKAALEKVAKDFLSENGVAKALKYADWDEYEVDEKGNLKDAKKHIKDLKEEWSDYVLKEEQEGANTHTPPEGNGGKALSMEDIYKKDEHGRYVMDAEQRQKEIAKQLSEGE